MPFVNTFNSFNALTLLPTVIVKFILINLDFCLHSVISEEGHKSNTSICRQHGWKEQHVYTSNGRNVNIELSKRTGTSEFLLWFQGI